MGKKNKLKTKKSAKKRFKVTGSGKVVRYKGSHTGHNTGKRRNSTMRKLVKQEEVPKELKNKISKSLGKG